MPHPPASTTPPPSLPTTTTAAGGNNTAANAAATSSKIAASQALAALHVQGCDFLKVMGNMELIKFLDKNAKQGVNVESVQFSDSVLKINKRDKHQKRDLIITTANLYNFKEHNYKTCQRAIPITSLKGIVISSKSDEVLIQVHNDYDYRLLIVRQADAIRILCELYEQLTNSKLNVEVLENLSLVQVLKADIKKARETEAAQAAAAAQPDDSPTVGRPPSQSISGASPNAGGSADTFGLPPGLIGKGQEHIDMKPSMEGFLTKKGDVNLQWRRRYFRLSETNLLYYEARLKGTIELVEGGEVRAWINKRLCRMTSPQGGNGSKQVIADGLSPLLYEYKTAYHITPEKHLKDILSDIDRFESFVRFCETKEVVPEPGTDPKASMNAPHRNESGNPRFYAAVERFKALGQDRRGIHVGGGRDGTKMRNGNGGVDPLLAAQQLSEATAIYEAFLAPGKLSINAPTPIKQAIGDMLARQVNLQKQAKERAENGGGGTSPTNASSSSSASSSSYIPSSATLHADMFNITQQYVLEYMQRHVLPSYLQYSKASEAAVMSDFELKNDMTEQDKKKPTCTNCLASFGVMKRRYVCKYCGDVFCSTCLSKSSKLPPEYGINEPIKVCDMCFGTLEISHAHPHAFSYANKSRARPINLAASSPQEMKQWMAAFRACISMRTQASRSMKHHSHTLPPQQQQYGSLNEQQQQQLAAHAAQQKAQAKQHELDKQEAAAAAAASSAAASSTPVTPAAAGPSATTAAASPSNISPNGSISQPSPHPHPAVNGSISVNTNISNSSGANSGSMSSSSASLSTPGGSLGSGQQPPIALTPTAISVTPAHPLTSSTTSHHQPAGSSGQFIPLPSTPLKSSSPKPTGSPRDTVSSTNSNPATTGSAATAATPTTAASTAGGSGGHEKAASSDKGSSSTTASATSSTVASAAASPIPAAATPQAVPTVTLHLPPSTRSSGGGSGSFSLSNHKEGWLMKEDPTTKIWRRRYFILNSATGHLYYYELTLKGSLSLAQGAGVHATPMRGTLSLADSLFGGMPSHSAFGFRFNISYQTRLYALAADTEEAMDKWMDALQRAIRRAKPGAGGGLLAEGGEKLVSSSAVPAIASSPVTSGKNGSNGGNPLLGVATPVSKDNPLTAQPSSKDSGLTLTTADGTSLAVPCTPSGRDVASTVASSSSSSATSSAEAYTSSYAQLAPEGEVTFVFTDVQNSTKLWEKAPDAMNVALELHDALLRTLLTMYKGYEVKTEGDAFMVTFFSPLDAVRWALACQQGLLELEYPPHLLEQPSGSKEIKDGQVVFNGIRIRMGIHVGFPACRRNPITGRMDYFGPCVNRSARVCDSAHGGQVVCTEEVYDAIQKGIKENEFPLSVPILTDLGGQKYKGISEMVQVFQINTQTLNGRNPFPPLRTTKADENADGTAAGKATGAASLVATSEEAEAELAAATAERTSSAAAPPSAAASSVPAVADPATSSSTTTALAIELESPSIHAHPPTSLIIDTPSEIIHQEPSTTNDHEHAAVTTTDAAANDAAVVTADENAAASHETNTTQTTTDNATAAATSSEPAARISILTTTPSPTSQEVAASSISIAIEPVSPLNVDAIQTRARVDSVLVSAPSSLSGSMVMVNAPIHAGGSKSGSVVHSVVGSKVGSKAPSTRVSFSGNTQAPSANALTEEKSTEPTGESVDTITDAPSASTTSHAPSSFNGSKRPSHLTVDSIGHLPLHNITTPTEATSSSHVHLHHIGSGAGVGNAGAIDSDMSEGHSTEDEEEEEDARVEKVRLQRASLIMQGGKGVNLLDPSHILAESQSTTPSPMREPESPVSANAHAPPIEQQSPPLSPAPPPPRDLYDDADV